MSKNTVQENIQTILESRRDIKHLCEELAADSLLPVNLKASLLSLAAEVDAIGSILIDKGIATREEWMEKLAESLNFQVVTLTPRKPDEK